MEEELPLSCSVGEHRVVRTMWVKSNTHYEIPTGNVIAGKARIFGAVHGWEIH